MTDAERLREWAEMITQWERGDPNDEATLYRRAAAALDRLAAIDAVFERFIQPELHKPESYAGRVIDEDTAREIAMIEKSGQCEDCIDELIAQNLLPPSKEVADGQ